MDDGSGAGFVDVGNTLSGSVLTYTKTGLTAETEYYFKVAASNSIGIGQDSVSTAIMAGIVPDQPSTP